MDVSDYDDGMTLAQAKAIVNEGRWDKKGVRCPCCNRYAKVYQRRTITIKMAKALRAQWDCARMECIHTGDVWSPYGHEPAQLQWWGLLAPGERSGEWSITPLGKLFLINGFRVFKFVSVYQGEVIDRDGSETINWHEASQTPFDYDDLMERRHDEWND